VSLSLADSARAALVNVAQNALVSGQDARRWGNAHANLVPYQLFETQDRPIVIAVGTDSQWLACARALGLQSLANDPALAANRGRLARREYVVAELSRALQRRPAAEWLDRFDKAGVPAGIVKGVLEVIAETKASPLVGMPSPIGGTARMPPPKLDENGVVIRRLGWAAFSGYR
jgi:crotonobetainyl-CoA:carnitine CoA-transferase CaiB-like acyl-CoA transferase